MCATPRSCILLASMAHALQRTVLTNIPSELYSAKSIFLYLFHEVDRTGHQHVLYLWVLQPSHTAASHCHKHSTTTKRTYLYMSLQGTEECSHQEHHAQKQYVVQVLCRGGLRHPYIHSQGSGTVYDSIKANLSCLEAPTGFGLRSLSLAQRSSSQYYSTSPSVVRFHSCDSDLLPIPNLSMSE